MTTLDLLGTGSSWLLTYALHSTLLIGGAWLVTQRMRTPVVRDTLWKSAMFGAMLTATIQVAAGYRPFAGRLDVSLNQGSTDALVAPVRLVDADVPPLDTRPSIPVQASPVTRAIEEEDAQAPGTAPTVAPQIETAAIVTATTPSPRSHLWIRALEGIGRMHWGAFLIMAWLLGATIGVTRLVWARLQLGRCLRSRRPVRDPSLRRFLSTFSRMAGIRRPIELSWSCVLAVPAALRTEVCLPKRALFEMNIEKHRSVIAHEVAHIARHDPVWFFASLLLERVFFFQPLNRLARRRMQELAEYICDDWAMHRAGSKRSLAESLADVAGWITHAQPITMLPSAGQDRSQLVRRVERILETTTTPEAWMPKRSRVAAVFVGLSLVALLLPGVSCAHAAATPTNQINTPPPVTQESVTPAPEYVFGEETPSVPEVDWIDVSATPAPLFHLHDMPVVPVADQVEDVLDHMSAIAPALDVHVSDVVDAMQDMQLVWEHEPVVMPDVEWPQIEMPDVKVWQTPPGVSVDTKWGHETQQDTPDPRVIRGLIEALGDQSAEVRKEAASALGRVGDSTAVMPLARALSDPSAEVRATAANALARYRDARAVPALAAALSDSESGVRRYALQALVRTRHESVIPALINALKDESPDVREMAADVLGDLKDTRAVPGLIDATRDPHPDVREEAIQSLYELRDSRAVTALIAATRDSVTKVRRIAASALGHFGDTNAVPALIDRLSDSAAIVRRYAISSLGRLKDARAVDPLVDALKDPDADVRTAAVRALSQLRASGTW